MSTRSATRMSQTKTLELAPAEAVVSMPTSATAVTPAVVAVPPTQLRRPWRTTVRTSFQALIGLAVLLPILVQTSGLDPREYPWLAVALAVAGAVARIMALPQVEAFLRTFLPFLSAAGRIPQDPDPAGVADDETTEVVVRDDAGDVEPMTVLIVLGCIALVIFILAALGADLSVFD